MRKVNNIKIYQQVHSERERAHEKHSHNGGSMEEKDWEHDIWSDVLGEEMGEVHRARCEHQLGNTSTLNYRGELRRELIQLAAMACAWIAAIDEVAEDA